MIVESSEKSREAKKARQKNHNAKQWRRTKTLESFAQDHLPSLPHRESHFIAGARALLAGETRDFCMRSFCSRGRNNKNGALCRGVKKRNWYYTSPRGSRAATSVNSLPGSLVNGNFCSAGRYTSIQLAFSTTEIFRSLAVRKE